MRRLPLLLLALAAGALALLLRAGGGGRPFTVAVPELKNEAILWSRAGVIEFLLDYGFEFGEPLPMLALSFEERAPGLFAVRLRPNVLFHDGTPFDAAAAARSIEAYARSGHGAALRDRLTCEAEGPLTLLVRSRSPGLDVPAYLGRIPMTPDGSVDSLGRVKRPVGTGPFRVVSFDERQELRLEANDRWWGGRPRLREVLYREVPDSSTRLLLLEAGEADWAVHLPLHELPRLRSRGFEVGRCRFLYNVYLYANPAAGVTGERAVRRAISLAIDRDRIAAAAFLGQARAAAAIYPLELPFVPGDLERARHDPDAAARILAEAGWLAPGPGAIRRRDGIPLRVSLLVPSPSLRPTWLSAAEMVRQDLERIGVALALQPIEAGAWVDRRRRGDFELLMTGRVPPWQGDPLSYFRNEFHSRGYANDCRFADAAFDAAVDRGLDARDRDERLRALGEAQRILALELPVIPLVHDGSREIYAVAPGVGGAAEEFALRNAFPGPRTRNGRKEP